MTALPKHLSDESLLIETLLRYALITPEGVDRVRAAALAHGLAFSRAATRLGVVSERDMARLFGELMGIGVLSDPTTPVR